MILVKTISQTIETLFRSIKVLAFGVSDVRTAAQAAPFGIDSAPTKDMIAILSDTGVKGKRVIVGYLNKSLLAGDGETRMFSIKSDGTLSQYIWLKNDGTMEIGGNADNAVRFSKLDDGLQDLKTKINSELTKIQTGITGLGGAYAKVDVSVDIAPAKIDEVKTS